MAENSKWLTKKRALISEEPNVEPAPPPKKSTSYPIMGHQVEFPEGKKPFPAQYAVMAKVLTALRKSQHALLESPTGSGKTLALLCSTLTFQQQQHLQNQHNYQQQLQLYQQQLVQHQQQESKLKKGSIGGGSSINSDQKSLDEDIDDESNDFLSQTLSHHSSIFQQFKYQKNTPDARTLPPSFELAYESNSKSVSQVSSPPPKKPKKPRLSTIYFASRTHSQLAQVVNELRNCPIKYRENLNMTILASREHYCVHQKLRRTARNNGSSINDECKKLVENNNCRYASKGKKVHELDRQAPKVWDIEELVQLGKDHRECPYFFSRGLISERIEIVFCPYNYLIDPQIRQATEINVENAIIIFDEGHNIEDVCRDAASCEFAVETIEDAARSFAMIIKSQKKGQHYIKLLKIANGILRWLKQQNELNGMKKSGFEEETKVCSGQEAVAIFDEYAGVNSQTIKQLGKFVTEVFEEENEIKENKNTDAKLEFLPSSALNTISEIVTILAYLLRDDMKNVPHYKLVVIKSTAKKKSYNSNMSSNVWEMRMCLWCLNPAVAFEDIASVSKSIILTSGTLSPMNSFAGELGVSFPIRLEANHVIDTSKQVWIGTVSSYQTPSQIAVDLKCTYANQQSFAYQDALGDSILQYSQRIKGGVLVFFPSYGLLHKLISRWEQTQLFDKLNKLKRIFVEPRQVAERGQFDALLLDYKESVKDGALFLAVYRGKVSEGIDFSDENARAVISVGIPYPNVKQLEVVLKRQYQDQNQPKLISGQVWYAQQAFRALNQALGRCIRHRRDYGVLILLDSRYGSNPSNLLSLSKWTRGATRQFTSMQQTLSSIDAFFDQVKLNPLLVVPSEPTTSSKLATVNNNIKTLGMRKRRFQPPSMRKLNNTGLHKQEGKNQKPWYHKQSVTKQMDEPQTSKQSISRFFNKID